jgi:hypothetical protein
MQLWLALVAERYLNAAQKVGNVVVISASADTTTPNDGFKIRDGHWCGIVKPHDHSLVAVNLYAGNEYWFSVGATEPAKKIAVSLYDETGKQVTTESYEDGEKAAAGFAPSSSGQYFVSVDLLEGEESSFCLVYSYK